jgi:hypothetical protein
MQEGLRVAAEIQASLLPHTPTQVPGYDLAGRTQSSEAAGGDLYDLAYDGSLLHLAHWPGISRQNVLASNPGTHGFAVGLWNSDRRGVCSHKPVGQRHDKGPKPRVPAQSLVQHLAGYQTHRHVGHGLHCGATRAWVKDSFFAKD